MAIIKIQFKYPYDQSVITNHLNTIMKNKTELITPGSFNSERHWYPKAINATIHPMISFFLNLERKRIISRYCHLHPLVDKAKLEEILSYRCKYFLWSGADLFNATSEEGSKQMVVIESNSCPSGQKSMPLIDDNKEEGSYRILVERTFKEYLKTSKSLKNSKGKLAVIYDKNYMENSGYASVISNVFNEEVFLVPFYDLEDGKNIKLKDGFLYVNFENEWHKLRGGFRYLTQKPWNRLPIHCKTKILNPIIACLGWWKE